MAGTNKPIIWIVEDKDALRSMLARVLRRLGDVSDFSTADEAIVAMGEIGAGRTRPDLIITDNDTGLGKNGLDVIDEANKIGIKVVMHASTTPEIALQALQKGAEAFFAKEGDINDLLTKVKDLLSSTPSEGAERLIRPASHDAGFDRK